MAITKKTWRILMPLVLLSGVGWLYWGNNAIEVTRITVAAKGAPEGLKIAHISDLHNKPFGDVLIDSVRQAMPDVIAVTGDLIDSRNTDVAVAMDFIRQAVQIAPVYYVTGNHESRVKEYALLEEQMTAAGVTILQDERTTIVYQGMAVELLGLEDPSFTAADDEAVALRLEKMMTGASGYTVLLSHRPELIEIYASSQADLVLCGHAHGGQFRLPLIGGLYAPGQGLLPHYTAGLHKMDQTNMVISRGLGNSLFPFRCNNRPELVVITIVGAEKERAAVASNDSKEA